MAELEDFVKEALECSVYAAPREPGLTYEEIHIVATQRGFKKGELDDALRRVRLDSEDGRLLPDTSCVRADFIIDYVPELRSPAAFDFIFTSLKDLAREVGKVDAWATRQHLVARGVAGGHKEHDLEVAISSFLLGEWLEKQDEKGLRLSAFRAGHLPPIQQVRQNGGQLQIARPTVQRTFEAVKDVVARRNDGRPRHPEPLEAFSEALDKLGHGRFRMWWTQTVAELRLTNHSHTPMTACVLAAALSEGALVFVVGYASKLNLGPMGSTDFKNTSSTTWKFEDLIKSASQGGQNAILDRKVQDRALQLNRARQRIHAGRLMADTPTGPIPDARPEEARDAVATAEQVVRKILDWLEAHPPQTTPQQAPQS